MLKRKTIRNEARDNQRVVDMCRAVNQLALSGDASKFRRKMIRLGNLLARVYTEWEPGKRLASLHGAHRPVRYYERKIKYKF